ncbi:hypothetical protein BJY59DRAFT_648086, partial [Rhodotorula toruloides]
MLPRSQWKVRSSSDCWREGTVLTPLARVRQQPDDEAENCADPDCSLRFDLINRRHHCRTCGDIFCAAHSSRSTLLW